MKQTIIRGSRFASRTAWLLRAVLFVFSVVVPVMVVYEFGYPINESTRLLIHNAYRVILAVEWVVITMIYVLGLGRDSGGVLSHHIVRTAVYVMVSAVVVLHQAVTIGWLQPDLFIGALINMVAVRIALLIVSVAQISRMITGFLGRKTNPSLILASSFALIIIVGSLLLLLPRCTFGELSWIDSLFVSTSAVCVTGLTPFDLSTTFTLTGQVVILILIQVGGLGIMTLTSFFGLFFSGGRTFSGQMVVGDILSTENLNSLLHTITKIIVVTLSIEAIGAFFLYISVYNAGVMNSSDALYFAIFHSISAFCNAGFSTLSGNLADPLIAALSSIRYVVCLLIICGGIGFPLFSNFLSFLAHKFRNMLRRIYGIRPVVKPHLWSLNNFIVVRTTLCLLVGGFVLFLVLEWNNSLSGMDLGEKLSQAFLMSVTPRTAGFNGVNLNGMLPSSILLTILLMWIGGAPQSTAGGIKVTTFFVAFKNIFSSSSRVGRLDVNHREIPHSSVARAFGVIALSLMTIGVAVFLMSIFDPEIPLANLVYEVVSAISTVGLSLSTTPLLTQYSKIVLILLMFAGRVGIVSLLLVFLRHKTQQKPYSWPEENILIN